MNMDLWSQTAALNSPASGWNYSSAQRRASNPCQKKKKKESKRGREKLRGLEW